MDRSRFISELIRLESRDLLEFAFLKHDKTLAPAVPTQAALLLVALPNNIADDEVTITCQLALDAKCEQTCTTSSSYWLFKKDPITGRPFQVPKSCTNCRDLKRKIANTQAQLHVKAHNVPHSISCAKYSNCPSQLRSTLMVIPRWLIMLPAGLNPISEYSYEGSISMSIF